MAGGSGRLRVGLGVLVLLAAQAAVPGQAAAQSDDRELMAPPDGVVPAMPIGESVRTAVKLAGANAAVSGAVAGVLQRLRGGSFVDGFTRGAYGGLMIYGGKRLAVSDAWGSGLLGRQVAAAGASVVHNAGAGLGSFDELVLPFGMVHVHRSADAERPVHLRFDLVTTAVLVRGVLDPTLRFAPGASLSSGAPVFRAPPYDPGHDEWLGHAKAGVIVVRERDPHQIRSLARERAVFAHERVHVLQDDQVAIGLGRSIQGAVLSFVPGGEWVDRRVDLGLHYLVMLPAAFAFGDAHMEFLEREAHRISGTDRIFTLGTNASGGLEAGSGGTQ